MRSSTGASSTSAGPIATSIRGRAAILGSVGLILCAVIASSTGRASAFDGNSFSTPIAGASDFATGFPHTPTRSGELGPLGMVNDGLNFFVSDPVQGRLYRFPLDGGAASDPSVLVRTGSVLTGLALSNGVYFGTSNKTIRTFNPNTLLVANTNVVLPCTAEGLAGDPLSSDLYVATACGAYVVTRPTASSPLVTKFSSLSDYLDGIAISGDGQDIWVADTSGMKALELDRSGTVVQSVPDPHGPDGISLVGPDVVVGGVDVSDNVFINDNDGTVLRVDTNSASSLSIVAAGGSRGDFSTVGPDGCLYATQSDRIERLEPCFLQPTNPPGTSHRCGTLTAPILLSTEPGDASATVSWAPTQYPRPYGCVAGYIVTPFLAGVAQPSTLIPGSGTTTVIEALTNGRAYTFTVAAEDGTFVGPASTPIGPVTVGAPAAATAVHATHIGHGAIRITFRAPRDNGARIMRYVASCTSANGGATRSATGIRSPVTMTRLSAGKTYRCTVTASNSRGTGPVSNASPTVTA